MLWWLCSLSSRGNFGYVAAAPRPHLVVAVAGIKSFSTISSSFGFLAVVAY